MESPLHQATDPDLKVLETLRFAGDQGFVRLDLHLARAARTCARLGYPFDAGAVRKALEAVVGRNEARCRLTIDRTGAVEVETASLPPAAPLWRVSIAAERFDSSDPWLGVKTTRRAIYERARAAMPEGAQEVVFLNEQGQLCEGSITNIFVPRDGVLLTPALDCGLLPGVLRQSLLDSGEAREARLTPDDLAGAEGFLLGNSLRGLIPAKML